MCMYEILKAGGLTGGLNFDAKNRRASYTPEDMFYGFILGMDTFALGLIKAAKLIEDGRIDAFVKERYASYNTGIGADIVSGNFDKSFFTNSLFNFHTFLACTLVAPND